MPKGVYSRPSMEDRFNAKFTKTNSCWEWKTVASKSKRGTLHVVSRNMMATHVSWFLRYGYWPDDCVLHKCDNPRCVNPDHLFLGSGADNMRDRDSKNRQPMGSKHGCSKLTEEQVRAMRNSSEDHEFFASRYDVHYSTIRRARAGKRWKHL